MAWVIPILLAYVPGLVVGFMASTLLLTPYREPSFASPHGSWADGEWPPVTVVIAAWNEERTITRTLEHIAGLAYEGQVDVVLVDNNSADATAEVARTAASSLGLDLRCLFEGQPGKHRALNTALAAVTRPILVTVDADTYLQREALTHLIARLVHSPQGQHVSACAGALVAENPQASFTSRMQDWDYRLGINGVKRMQAAYNTALVAQGAFSAYSTEDVRAVGGWPNAIGEDIVLTWAMLQTRGLVQYEPVALGFTTVPTRLRALLTQRSRWARGMFEGIRAIPPRTQHRVLARLVASIDYLVPLLDIGVVFFWVPGVILLAFGYPIIVGWWSILLLPITLALFGFLRWWQERHVFRLLGIHPARNARGFVGYLFLYQPVASAAALHGYSQYVLRRQRRWQ